jgi:catechol-2,3-dioxygenase
MTRRGFRRRALGEIAVRTRNIEATTFYRYVLGLRVLSTRNQGEIVLFRLSDGFAGHTAGLALFDESEADDD